MLCHGGQPPHTRLKRMQCNRGCLSLLRRGGLASKLWLISALLMTASGEKGTMSPRGPCMDKGARGHLVTSTLCILLGNASRAARGEHNPDNGHQQFDWATDFSHCVTPFMRFMQNLPKMRMKLACNSR